MRVLASVIFQASGPFFESFGSELDVAFHLKLLANGELEKEWSRTVSWRGLDNPGVISVPEISRSAVMMTGMLRQSTVAFQKRIWRQDSAMGEPLTETAEVEMPWIESVLKVGITQKPSRYMLARMDQPFGVMGELFAVVRQPWLVSVQSYRVHVHDILSLNLDSGDERFGQWMSARSPGDLKCNPDETTATVMLLDLEVLSES